ncbi:hypothetical protein ACOZ38_03600 [Sphaerisporangium viridialbum]|uniref:hypothetical protein n=1 Tax=Sphaerisporangium viridialbum TaxID=46189 RepID=UPI003C742E77
MSRELDIHRTWVEQTASRRMQIHGEDYGAAVRGPAGGEIGGASWGETGLIAECAAAFSESGRHLHELLSDLGLTMDQTGERLRVASTCLGEVDTAVQRDADRLHDLGSM